jgi:23S rRNA-/tRNA-specific pseudouridylate synthase
MTAPGENCDITPYDKSAHLLICSPAIKVVSVPIRYLALVYGHVKEDSGSVALSIGRHPVDRKKMSTRVAKPGALKPAGK